MIQFGNFYLGVNNMDKEERYEIKIRCWNCNKEEMVSIPKGTSVEKYRDGKICNNCDCLINEDY